MRVFGKNRVEELSVSPNEYARPKLFDRSGGRGCELGVELLREVEERDKLKRLEGIFALDWFGIRGNYFPDTDDLYDSEVRGFHRDCGQDGSDFAKREGDVNGVQCGEEWNNHSPLTGRRTE
jgi:hypothetical protein